MIYNLPDFYDPDNDATIILSFGPLPLPSWITSSVGSKFFSFSPKKGDIGNYTIQVFLNDTKEVASF